MKNSVNCLESLTVKDEGNQQPSSVSHREGSTTIPKGSTLKRVEARSMKVCRICGVEKPLEKFYFRKDAKKHRTECKACIKDMRREAITGCTREQYDELFEQQKGCCFICGVHNSKLTNGLAADHCHKSNKVRKLLCSNCNTALGLVKDSPEILNKMVKYLNLHEDIV